VSESPHSTPQEAAIVSLGDEEGVKRATVNNLSRLRPSRRDRYRVTVFGSARTQPGHWVYEEVKRMCAALSAMGCDIVTGGGPGLMQAANEGAHQAQADSRVQNIGIRVDLPFEQEVNPSVEQAFGTTAKLGVPVGTRYCRSGSQAWGWGMEWILRLTVAGGEGHSVDIIIRSTKGEDESRTRRICSGHSAASRTVRAGRPSGAAQTASRRSAPDR
jgi:hypothetical protein